MIPKIAAKQKSGIVKIKNTLSQPSQISTSFSFTVSKNVTRSNSTDIK